jgi:hypothetical protein
MLRIYPDVAVFMVFIGVVQMDALGCSLGRQR